MRIRATIRYQGIVATIFSERDLETTRYLGAKAMTSWAVALAKINWTGVPALIHA